MSQDEEIHNIAILSPKPEKAERVRPLLSPLPSSTNPPTQLHTLLHTLITHVHATEPTTLRYLMLTAPSTSTPDTDDIIFIEKYASQAANEKHVQSEEFQKVFTAIGEEGLLRSEMVLKRGRVVGGFDLDRKFV
ncbi:hypothetical protein PRZ48_008129 [Zasmidium cellare]|uniref:ABM domain-containing protein n=1 Tax=Zasmidium cellare TaxID=395010 RepID=A0ABR0EFV7_ZASCE|nr:hypothetical protein PRZ48_008129 [Zasmidium cellare]